MPAFEAPGPGTWARDAVHFPRPVTRYWAEMHPEPFHRGTQRLRPLLRDADRRSPDGVRERLRVQPAGAGTRGRGPASASQRAEEVFARKLWREQLREWDETSKPNAIAKHREIQAVDPDSLSDDELIAYLTPCRDHHSRDDHAAHALHRRRR